MRVIIATLRIKPDDRDAFLEAIAEDARGSVHDEPGCLRFDVLQDQEDPNRIHLYEAYRDDAAIETHRQAPHYLKWRAAVDRHGFIEETSSRQCLSLFPPDSEWHK